MLVSVLTQKGSDKAVMESDFLNGHVGDGVWDLLVLVAASKNRWRILDEKLSLKIIFFSPQRNDYWI